MARMSDHRLPPRAQKRPLAFTQHGDTRVDDYYWLRNRRDAFVLDYLEAENAYTEAMMAQTGELQAVLFGEMKARIQEEDSTVPEKRGEYFYYSRTEAGRQYAVYCRRHRSPDAPEEVLLDVNALAAGHGFCKIGVIEPSPDGRLLAYSVDYAGDERFMLSVKDLRTGRLLPEHFTSVYSNVYDHSGLAWANDSSAFFYSTLDSANRSHKLFRHHLGTEPSTDTLIHHETDESYMLVARKTRSEAFVLAVLHNNTTSEVWYAPAGDARAEWRVLLPRTPGIEYSVDHHGDNFYVLTNESALNFRVMALPVERPSREHWREIVPERAEVLIDGLDVFRNHLVLYERSQANKHIRVSAPDGTQAHYVPFAEPAYAFWPQHNPHFDARHLRIEYSSLVTPDSVVDVDLDTGEWRVKKRAVIPSGYEAAEYQAERITATAPDGAQVPISLVYKKGLRRAAGNPLLMQGYGAYGFSLEPMFNSARLSLLDRGFIYAIAHIRGGSDCGRRWYEQGKLLHKKNTFTDFIAAAEHLIANGYTTRDRLAIFGVSAGGLLTGAVTTMRPDLFGCVIAKVPFVDVINTMNDDTIPLTVTEWEEWGHPSASREHYEYMKSYSPYDNVQARAYPPMLVTAGLNDPRVAFWEPAKFTAKLRALKTDSNRLLLKTNMGAGHAGASGRYDALHETAFEYAFILDALGLNHEEHEGRTGIDSPRSL
jgi:oligopeptidase B